MATQTLSTTNPLDTMSSPLDQFDSPHNNNDFLKMEDIDNTTTTDMDFDATSPSSQVRETPAPVTVYSKPAKKRKSWGQQLPEPKTTLPPRKRAKTDDEKEQRRIERIKRNRAAAHNSRERKRQEAEVLAVENAKLKSRLEAFEKHFGPLPKHIVLPEVQVCIDDADTPAPSLIESRGSVATAPSPASPPDLYDFTSNDITIKQEPHDSPFSDYHHAFDTLDGKQPMPTFAPLDETQHSAEMLCDLPCPSSSRTVARSSNPLLLPCLSAMTSTLLLMAALNLTFLSTYKTLMLAMWTHSPSRLVRAISASTRASTSPSTTSSTPRASRMHPRSPSATALAQLNAATAVARFAALRRPLVGEGTRRTGDLAMAARRERGLHVTMALRRGDGERYEQDGKGGVEGSQDER